MRVGIALMVEDELANRMTSISLRLREFGFNLRVLRLWPHVSLKQPFMVDDFERFEAYFDGLAARLEPQLLHFAGFCFWSIAETVAEGVVVLQVLPNARLQQLHAQLNAELEHEFGGTQADFDGDDYKPHLTVGIGPYRASELPRLEQALGEWTNEAPTVASKLGMFVYEERPQPDALYGRREWGVYRVRKLEGAADAIVGSGASLGG